LRAKHDGQESSRDNEVRGVKAMPGAMFVPHDGVVKMQLIEVSVRREGR
jgi:hypothetical protein